MKIIALHVYNYSELAPHVKEIAFQEICEYFGVEYYPEETTLEQFLQITGFNIENDVKKYWFTYCGKLIRVED